MVMELRFWKCFREMEFGCKREDECLIKLKFREVRSL